MVLEQKYYQNLYKDSTDGLVGFLASCTGVCLSLVFWAIPLFPLLHFTRVAVLAVITAIAILLLGMPAAFKVVSVLSLSCWVLILSGLLVAMIKPLRKHTQSSAGEHIFQAHYFSIVTIFHVFCVITPVTMVALWGYNMGGAWGGVGAMVLYPVMLFAAPVIELAQNGTGQAFWALTSFVPNALFLTLLMISAAQFVPHKKPRTPKSQHKQAA